MNKYLLMLPIAFIAVGGCSSEEDIPAPKSPGMITEQAAPKKISPDNAFSTQINALDTAKMVGAAAQKSIDNNQQKLDDAAHQAR